MIEEGDSRKSPQKISNQTNQVKEKEEAVILQVNAESKMTKMITLLILKTIIA